MDTDEHSYEKPAEIQPITLQVKKTLGYESDLSQFFVVFD